MPLRIEFVDDDWQVVEPGRDMPIGYWKPKDKSDEEMAKARAKAVRFMEDLNVWLADPRRKPLERPTSEAAKYQ